MRTFKKIMILIFSVAAAVCMAACFSACKHTEDGTVNEPLSHTKGEWDRQNGVYIGMVSDDDCPAGDIDDRLVKSDVEMKTGEEYYLIIDFILQASEDNDGGGTVNATIKINPSAVVDITLQETASGTYTEKTLNDIKEINIPFSIPDKAEERRDKRIVLRLMPVKPSDFDVNISFESNKPVAGDITKNQILKSIASQYTGGLQYTETQDGGYSVTAGSADIKTDLVIPFYINGKYVLEIGSEAFKGVDALTSVTIPYGVKSIGDSAFAGCEDLTEIIIPDGVTEIGNSTFKNCSGLTNIILPDGITSIGSYAFYNCSNLKSIDLPDSVKLISDNAFYGCDGLESITLGKGINSIGRDAFAVCGSQKTVYYAGDMASWCAISGLNGLLDCGSIAYDTTEWIIYINGEELTGDITIPYGVTSIDSAFSFRKGITSVTIPNSVTNIGYCAFWCCNSLTSVIIPDGVTNIGEYAFGGCKGLTDITIPDSVLSIGYGAFYYCSSLTDITIPDSVRSIGESAFYECNSLNFTVYDNACYLGNQNNMHLVLVKSVNTDITSCNINSNTKFIYNRAFAGCSKLWSITVPESVTDIGVNAFGYGGISTGSSSDCDRLTVINYTGNMADWFGISGLGNLMRLGSSSKSLTIDGKEITGEIIVPDNVTSIADYAFADCKGLKSVTIPNSVTSIGSSAFSGCSGLTDIIIPNSVTIIGSSAFSGCSGLTEITIPDSVTSIGSSAFYGCSRLTEIIIPNSVTIIGDYAFRGCSGLTDIIVPDSVTELGSAAFYNCYNLTNVVLSKNLKILDSSTFGDCKGLTEIIIPDGVTSIGAGAFSYCRNLTTILIPDSLKNVGKDAFLDCRVLNRVYYGGTAKDWNEIEIDRTSTVLDHTANNVRFRNAARYYYSETEPAESGNYWRYVNGKPVAW